MKGALSPGAIQGKEGINFCHLATLMGRKGRRTESERPFVSEMSDGEGVIVGGIGNGEEKKTD